MNLIMRFFCRAWTINSKKLLKAAERRCPVFIFNTMQGPNVSFRWNIPPECILVLIFSSQQYLINIFFPLLLDLGELNEFKNLIIRAKPFNIKT